MPRTLANIILRKIRVEKENILINHASLTKRNKIRIHGLNNSLEISAGFNIKNSLIKIIGERNNVYIGSNLTGKNLHIEITGSDNNIFIGDNIIIYDYLTIAHNNNGNNCELKIGNQTSFFGTEIHIYDSGSSVSIGNNCMLSKNVTIYHSDGHSIFQNGILINQAKKLIIKDNVWIGWDVTILKNSYIAKGCIIGRSSLVSGNLTDEDSIYAGIPAKKIKSNISWDRKTVNQIQIK